MTGTGLAAAATGFALGLTLIIAIGAQNAFVLRQGLRREHVGLVVAFCASADALLMAAGVAGLGTVIGRQPALAAALAGAGALFLAVYGSRALWRALRPGSLDAAGAAPSLSRQQALAQVAAFTLLNPHVYLDTVLLVGAVGAQHEGPTRIWFVVGSAGASVLWFTALGYGARLLAPVFARPRAWQWLDSAIGITMWVLALLLLRHALGG
jgi:L-lysine exporter family protein LysE/ArgO